MEMDTAVAYEPTIQQRIVWRLRWFFSLFEKKRPSSLVLHAKREFLALGYKPVEEGEGGPNQWMQENVLQLLEVFSKQGHSGFSAPYCVSMFEKLARFEPLGPLTGEDHEWNDVSDMGGRDYGPLWQNNRASHVFKDSDGAFDVDGVIFREPNGCTFIGRYSRVPVTFPYTPKRVYAEVAEDATDDDKRNAAIKALAESAKGE